MKVCSECRHCGEDWVDLKGKIRYRWIEFESTAGIFGWCIHILTFGLTYLLGAFHKRVEKVDYFTTHLYKGRCKYHEVWGSTLYREEGGIYHRGYSWDNSRRIVCCPMFQERLACKESIIDEIKYGKNV